MKTKMHALFILCCMLIQVPAYATLTATLDKTETSLNQPVQLTIVSDQKQAAQKLVTSGLEQDFNIVGQSSSSELTTQNGVASSKSVVLLILMAKREGDLSIPALQFGNEQTAPLSLKVTASSIAESPPIKDESAPGVLIETLWEHSGKAYVQGQLNLIIRIYHQGNLLEARVDEPQAENTLIKRIGDDAPGARNKGGVQYQTIERRYALFPQKSGTLTIPPVTLQVRIPGAQRQTNRRFGFDPFMRGRQILLSSDPISIEITPPAANFTGPTWLPSDAVTLGRSGLPDGSINRGDAINMQIELSALGLTGAQLPEVKISGVNKHFKLYPDQPAFADRSADGLTITGSRIQTFVLIAPEAGSLEIPKIEVTWWDRKNDRQQYASLPAVNIKVQATKSDTKITQHSATLAVTEKPLPDTENTEQHTHPTQADGVSPAWKWISLASLCGWLISFAWFLFYHNKDRDGPSSGNLARKTTDLRPLLKQIKAAASTDNAQQTWQALQAYARIRWPNQSPHSPEDWARLLECPQSGPVLTELDSCLFHQLPGSAWRGEAVCKVLLPRLDISFTTSTPTTEAIVPEMYPPS